MRLKRHFLSFLVLLVFSGFLQAQVSYKDRLQHMTDDTLKVKAIRQLVDSLRERSSREALQLALEGKLLAERLAYKKGIAHMLESIAWMHYRNSDLSEALRIATEALSIAKQINDKSIIASSLISIAAIYFDQKQFETAIIHFREAAYISKKAGDFKTYGRSLGNIGFSFIQLGKYDSAIHYTTLSYDLAKRTNEFYVLGFSCRNFGEIAVAQANFARAIIYYNEGISLADASNNNYLKISLLYRLGAVYNHLRNPDRAIPLLQKAVQIGKKYSYRDELESSLRQLAESYILLDDPLTAYAFQSEYIALHDSLTNRRRIEQLSIAQTKFDSELKQAQIEVLTRDAALQQESYNQQRLVTYLSIACAAVFLIFMFVLSYNNRRIKGAKKVVEHRNAEIKKQTTLLRESNATKDKLFSIISHDLRSPLGGLKGLMELISREGLTQEEFIQVSKNLRKNIDSVYDDLDNLLHWAQAQLNGIKSNKGLFNLFELVSSKIHLFEEVARNKELLIVNAVDASIYLQADINQIGLVIRNLLANAVKFSHVRGRIQILAQRKGSNVEISVTDTGVGMSPAEVDKLFQTETHFTKRGTGNEKGMGLGLLLAKEFVEGNGGEIFVESEVGKGSTFKIILKNQKASKEQSILEVA
jgi:two-component system, sensor histidine kinase and response regulator